MILEFPTPCALSNGHRHASVPLPRVPRSGPAGSALSLQRSSRRVRSRSQICAAPREEYRAGDHLNGYSTLVPTSAETSLYSGDIGNAPAQNALQIGYLSCLRLVRALQLAKCLLKCGQHWTGWLDAHAVVRSGPPDADVRSIRACSSTIRRLIPSVSPINSESERSAYWLSSISSKVV